MNKIKRMFWIITSTVLLMFLMSGCDLFIKTNDGKVDPYWYMNLTNENDAGEDEKITSKEGEVIAVALDSDYSMEPGLKIDDEIFINIKTVKDEIDDAFHWDKVEKKLLFADYENIDIVSLKEPTFIANNKTPNMIKTKTWDEVSYKIVCEDKGEVYVNVKYIERKTNLNYKFIKSKGKYPSIVTLANAKGKYKTATVDSDIEIRTKGNYQNLIVANAKEDSEVRLLDKGENWSKIKTDNGIIGYVPTKYIEDVKTNASNIKDETYRYKHIKHDGDIKMVWHPIYSMAANAQLAEKIKNVEGINVIAPTWFSPADGNGGLASLASADYVRCAHKNGMQVWALAEDISKKKESAKMLSSTKSRFKFIRNLLVEADAKGVDGINVDFEYVTKETAADYREFLRELSVDCRHKHFVLSIDNYPTEEDTYYDITQQSKLADYIVSMSYDEHNVNSREAGSVSSINFTEKAIKAMIKHVGDSSRVINACPLYTRLWDSTPEGKGSNEGQFIEDAVNGNYYLSSQVIGMDLAKKAYKKAGATPTFDKSTGQNYVTWEDGDVLRQMWLEDETSIGKRMELAKNYKLAGSAFWALGFENDNIWKVIK